MGFLKNIFNKSPEVYEQNGDSCIRNGLPGPAKIEYEKAIEKLIVLDKTEERGSSMRGKYTFFTIAELPAIACVPLTIEEENNCQGISATRINI